MDTQGSNIQSHILLPKFLLKRFEDERHFLYYLGIEKDSTVKISHAKSLNTKKGYYSPEVERYLQINIENPFSKVLKVIDSADYDLNDVYIDNEMADIVKDYALSLYSRSPFAIESLNETSIYFRLFPIQDKADIAVSLSQETGTKNNIFQEYQVTIMINKTNVPFVLPLSGMYGFEKSSKKYILMPVSPKRSLVLIEHEKKVPRKIFEIDDDSIVNFFNLKAYKHQCNQQYGYIICDRKDTLEEIKENSAHTD